MPELGIEEKHFIGRVRSRLNFPCGKAIEPANRPALRTAKPGSGEAADHNSLTGHDRHAWMVRTTKDLRFAAHAACHSTRQPRT